jgi:hypothetical protein
LTGAGSAGRERAAKGSRESGFARSYLTHVALGEGCNCAESVLRLRHGEWPAPQSLRPILAALAARLAGILRRSG